MNAAIILLLIMATAIVLGGSIYAMDSLMTREPAKDANVRRIKWARHDLLARAHNAKLRHKRPAKR